MNPHTETYADWYQQVCRPPANDYVFVISASSKTPVSGTGKTTLMTGLCKALDRSKGGFDAEEQATLNANEFANEVIPNAPYGAAVAIDESQGTPGEGSGLNRMRAMSEQVMDSVGSLLANRDKSLTVVIVVQQFHMLFSDFYPLVDNWLLIRYGPGQAGGPQVISHDVYSDDYHLGGSQLKTPIRESLSWPPISHDDPDYRYLEQAKQEAKEKGRKEEDSDDDDGLSKEAQKQLAQTLRNRGLSLREIAKVDAIDYKFGWVQKHTEPPDSGQTVTA